MNGLGSGVWINREMEKWCLDYKGTHGKEKEWKCLWCVVYENEMFMNE